MKNAGSSPIIVPLGNAAAPYWGAPFAITETVARRGPVMGAPNLTGNAPRLPLIDKAVPQKIAAKVPTNARAIAQTRAITTANRAVRRTRGYVNSLLMRQSGTKPLVSRR